MIGLLLTSALCFAEASKFELAACYSQFSTCAGRVCDMWKYHEDDTNSVETPAQATRPARVKFKFKGEIAVKVGPNRLARDVSLDFEGTADDSCERLRDAWAGFKSDIEATATNLCELLSQSMPQELPENAIPSEE